MKFQHFASFSDYNPINENKKILSELDAFNLFKKYCSWYTDATAKIYRGVKSDEDFLIITSKDFTVDKYYNRRSYSTILVSEVDSWKEWPKRYESIVCTTGRDIASTYGTLYRVLPVSGSEICITPKQSLEYCFKRTVLSKFKFGIYSEIDMLIEKLFAKMGKIEGNLNSKEFYTRLNKLQDKKFQQDFMSDETTNESVLILFEELNKFNGSTKEYFSEILNPNTAGFLKQKITAQFDINGQHEIWFKGGALLVKESKFNEFTNHYKKSNL